MRVQVLGASGGIGGARRTMALRVDEDLLIDAGTGALDLELEALAAIDRVLLTHAHLDHVVALPLMLDAVGGRRSAPLTVHAREETLNVLARDVFNGSLWPDFSRLPTPRRPFLRFETLAPGTSLSLQGRRITGLPVHHSIPAMGYLLEGPRGSLAYTGDTGVTDDFWREVGKRPDLQALLVECTFPDGEEELCRLARHLCPRLLAGELAKLSRRLPVYITHLQPGLEDRIWGEIRAHLPDNIPRLLVQGQVFSL